MIISIMGENNPFKLVKDSNPEMHWALLPAQEYQKLTESSGPLIPPLLKVEPPKQTLAEQARYAGLGALKLINEIHLSATGEKRQYDEAMRASQQLDPNTHYLVVAACEPSGQYIQQYAFKGKLENGRFEFATVFDEHGLGRTNNTLSQSIVLAENGQLTATQAEKMKEWAKKLPYSAENFGAIEHLPDTNLVSLPKVDTPPSLNTLEPLPPTFNARTPSGPSFRR